MEKRLALAFILSFVVLYFWFGLTPPASRQTFSSDENPQVVDSKILTDIKKPIPAAIPSEPNPVVLETFRIGNDHIDVEISNIGATIRSINLKKFEIKQPFIELLAINEFSKIPFQPFFIGADEAHLVYEDNDFKIVRKYKIENDYLINSDVIFQNKTNMSKIINMDFIGIKFDMSILDIESLVHEKSLFEYAINGKNQFFRKNNAYKFNQKDNFSSTEAVNWLAFRDRYFCSIVKPQQPSLSYSVTAINDTKLDLGISYGEITIDPGASINYDFIVYSGPEELSKLKSYGYGFEDVKKFYRFVLFDAIAKIIYEFLHWIHKFITNWGVCIILISAIIYFSMYPLTLRSMQSMKKMQQIQPKINDLREKYKDNPQRLNKEMMEIYREEKINPLGGCIPLLFQMPVFVGLYQVLWRDVSFKGADFLWIKDLSAPDRLYILPVNVPFVGNEVNLLPFVMMGVMFIQTRLQAKNMIITDPAQLAQQKMMGLIMPVFLCVIFYKFASGLTLYFTMFYIFSTVTQWKMYKKVDK